MIKGLDILQRKVSVTETFYPPTNVISLYADILDIKEFLMVGFDLYAKINPNTPDFNSINGGVFSQSVSYALTSSERISKNFHMPISSFWNHRVAGAINEIYKDVNKIRFYCEIGFDSPLTDDVDLDFNAILYYQPLRY